MGAQESGAQTAGVLGLDEPDLIVAAGAVIRDLFSVGLTLESCAENVDAQVGRRLLGAVDQLDAAITRMRRLILATASARS